MPEVFATGFLVGLLEWTCIQAVNPHIDWPREQTVGTHVNVSHEAATIEQDRGHYVAKGAVDFFGGEILASRVGGAGGGNCTQRPGSILCWTWLRSGERWLQRFRIGWKAVGQKLSREHLRKGAGYVLFNFVTWLAGISFWRAPLHAAPVLGVRLPSSSP
jgi:hypothetical protein